MAPFPASWVILFFSICIILIIGCIISIRRMRKSEDDPMMHNAEDYIKDKIERLL